MNKSRKTSHILNVFQYDETTGAVTLPSTLSLTAPSAGDNSSKVATTAWARTFVASLSYLTSGTTTTSDIGEGTNLYYTQSRFNTAFGLKTTTDLTEGTNLYYTDSRVGTYLTNNSYATQSYVGTQLANLVAAAPATLDTLNELAAALGNDPSFATTVSTSIGTKVPQTRTLTINGTAYDLSADRAWTITSMIYPGAGIAVSTGTAWGTSITDNSTNWNTAYGWGNHASAGYLTSATAATTYVSLTGSYANPSWITSLAYSKITGVPAFLTSYTETDPYRVTAVAVSGTSTKTITITRADASTVTTTWTDIDTDTNTYVTSAAFSGGTLTLTRNDAGTVSVSLDGRYYLATNPSGYITGITSSMVTTALGYTPYNSTNPNGYITGITSSNVTTALGYTPYNSTNPSGYITSSGSISGYAMSLNGYANQTEYIILTGPSNGPVIKVRYDSATANRYIDIGSKDGNGVYSEGLKIYNGGTLTFGGSTIWHQGNLTNLNQLSNGPGYITGITSANVTTALGFTPYNSTNPSGYITGITSSNVTTALGYTPYNSSNPAGYITSSGNISGYAGYLPTSYIGGVQANPQTYFNNGVGVKVAMTGSWSTWSDTLWINGYSGGDVKQMCALHTLRNGTPRMAISVQAHDATSYGTYYEFITSYNIASQTVASAGNATTAGGLAVHTDRNNEANKIVRTDGNGYIQAGWINTLSGDNGTSAITRIYASDDGYIRFYTPANFRQVLDVPTRTGGSASGTWGISISGNAATATTASSLAANTSPTIQVLNFTGVGTNSGNVNQSYAIYQEGGAWSPPFPDLCIGYHTGIKLGAYFGYNGIRFFNNSDFATQTFSVNDGDNHVRVAYNLYVGGTISGSNLSGTNTGDQTNISGNAATATFATSSSRLYSTDTAYNYSSANPYYGYLTYDGTYWLFKVSPASPDRVRVYIADNASAVAWTNVSGRPTAVSSFTNDSGYLTSVGIGNMTDVHRLFNNMGNTHGTYQDFNSVGNFGVRYMQGSTNGPESGQHYGFTLGLGNDYSYGTYATQFYWLRNTTNPYIRIRYQEGGSWGSWTKTSAAYADSAGSLSSMNISQFTNNSGYVTSSHQHDTLYWSGSARLYTGSDGTRNTGWAYHNDNGTGIHWPNNGWHIYPINASDMYIRSGASDCSLKFTKNGTSGSYIHCAADNAIGFLTTGRSWSLRVDDSGGGTFYGGLTVKGPIYIDANEDLYLNYNYGCSVVGVYASTRFQGVYSMGNAYKLSRDGTTPGNLYGLAWSHPNAGGQAGYLDNHGLLVMLNGTTYSAISNSIWARGDVTAYSDARVKTNIEVVENAIEKIKAIRGVTFNRTDMEHDTKRHAGVIAQEVLAVLPEVVTTTQDGMHSVAYGNLAALFIEAIKEQQKEIDELKSLINGLTK